QREVEQRSGVRIEQVALAVSGRGICVPARLGGRERFVEERPRARFVLAGLGARGRGGADEGKADEDGAEQGEAGRAASLGERLSGHGIRPKSATGRTSAPSSRVSRRVPSGGSTTRTRAG